MNDRFDRLLAGLCVCLVRRRHSLQPFKCSLLERFAVIRMGNLDQLVGTLTQRFAEQIGDTVLGDNVVHVSTGRYDAGACRRWEKISISISRLNHAA